MESKKKKNSFKKCDVLLIVPPSAWLAQPSLACHLLQGCAKERGFEVAVLYANIKFASLIGEEYYPRLMEYSRTHAFLDRTFGIQAFGMPNLGESERAVLPQDKKNLEESAVQMLDWVEEVIGEIQPKVVGCTCSYEQTAASMAIFSRCKKVDSRIITIMGGANCEDEMAEGIHSFGGDVDYVASGESEKTFPEFLEQVLVKKNQVPKILYGQPCHKLDDLPTPVYWEFFEQYNMFIPESEMLKNQLLAIPYETSRGCWWGQKHHCTFCGLNGFGMAFREKSKEKALEEYKHFVSTYPVKRINTVDNIMPHKFFGDFLEEMATEMPEDLNIFYEQKANISLEKAIQLRDAKVLTIQPGIESLDSDLLRIMDKGVRAQQNLALLRYGRSLGIRVLWNLLSHFPGDRIQSYERMLALLPKLSHLQPPKGPCRIVIDRFSPYFSRPQMYGIKNVRPKPYYALAFPEHADLPKLAYHFDGDFETECNQFPEVLSDLKSAINTWREKWEDKQSPIPILRVRRMFDRYLLEDTRGLPGSVQYQFIEEPKVAIILGGVSLNRRHERDVVWALKHNLIWEMDGRFIPLVTAVESLLKVFDKPVKKQALDNITIWPQSGQTVSAENGMAV